MNKIKFIILVLVFSTMAYVAYSSDSTVLSKSVSDNRYTTQHEAAAMFYNNFIDVINGLDNAHELIGLVVSCVDGFSYTNYTKGGLDNHVGHEISGDCSLVAIVHTHPEADWDTNRFSLEDMKTATQSIDVYVRGPDCIVRYANGHITSIYGEIVYLVQCDELDIVDMNDFQNLIFNIERNAHTLAKELSPFVMTKHAMTSLPSVHVNVGKEGVNIKWKDSFLSEVMTEYSSDYRYSELSNLKSLGHTVEKEKQKLRN